MWGGLTMNSSVGEVGRGRGRDRHRLDFRVHCPRPSGSVLGHNYSGSASVRSTYTSGIQRPGRTTRQLTEMGSFWMLEGPRHGPRQQVLEANLETLSPGQDDAERTKCRLRHSACSRDVVNLASIPGSRNRSEVQLLHSITALRGA